MTEPTITAKQFADEYAANSDTTLERLHSMDFVVAPCHCGAENYCRGWQMMSRATAALDIELKIGHFREDEIISLMDLA